MPKPQISPEQRKTEAEKLRAIFARAQDSELDLTQESLAAEMDVTQGLITQWFSGKKTPIPDKRLIWLSRRFKFNPLLIRPSMEISADSIASDLEKLTIKTYLTNPDFRKIVNAIAESQGYHLKQSGLQSSVLPVAIPDRLIEEKK